MAVLVGGLSAGLTGGFRYLVTSKQRAAAVTAANAMIERARSVAAVNPNYLGLETTDAGGDADITVGNCSGQMVQMFAGEPVMFASTAKEANPLWPHVNTVSVGSTQITLRTYVTGKTDDGVCSPNSPTYKHVTVLATWAKPQAGVSNQVRVSTFVAGAVRELNPALQGTSSYQVGSIKASTALAGLPAGGTDIFLASTSADGRNVGNRSIYQSTALGPAGQALGLPLSTQHSAAMRADDDDSTDATNGYPTPNCDPSSGSYAWSDAIGGLLTGNLVGSGDSCSSVPPDDPNLNPAGDLPWTTAHAGLLGFSMATTVPALSTILGPVPAFDVTAYLTSSAATSTSSVTRSETANGNRRITGASTAQLPVLALLGFSVLGDGPSVTGALQVSLGSASATAIAGQGSPSDPVPASSITGPIVIKAYDPDNTILDCSSRSSGFCVFNINPAAGGFSGWSRSFTITRNLNLLNLFGLPVTVAKITLQSTISIPAPIIETNGTPTTGITFAKATFPLPKITTSVTESLLDLVPVSTVTDTLDFGQIVSVASYQPAS